VSIKNATKKTKNLELKLESNIYALIDKKELDMPFQPNITLNENLKAPISSGTVVGTATYNIDGINYTSNLLAAKDVKKSHTAIIVTLIIIFAVLVAVYVYLDTKKNQKKRTHRIEKLASLYNLSDEEE